MATNVTLDEKLITEAVQLGSHPSKKAAIEDALREYVLRRRQREVVGLFGQIDYEPGYNYKAGRRKR